LASNTSSPLQYWGFSWIIPDAAGFPESGSFRNLVKKLDKAGKSATIRNLENGRTEKAR
jgi:hypothetical protein